MREPLFLGHINLVCNSTGGEDQNDQESVGLLSASGNFSTAQLPEDIFSDDFNGKSLICCFLHLKEFVYSELLNTIEDQYASPTSICNGMQPQEEEMPRVS